MPRPSQVLHQVREWLAVRAVAADPAAWLAVRAADRRSYGLSPGSSVRADRVDMPIAGEAGRLTLNRRIAHVLDAYADAITLRSVDPIGAVPRMRIALRQALLPPREHGRGQHSRMAQQPTPVSGTIDRPGEGIEVRAVHATILSLGAEILPGNHCPHHA
jgi:hypothetical protein